MLSVVGGDLQTTWRSVVHLDAKTVSDNWLVLTSIGSLGTFFVIAVILAHKQDVHSRRVSAEEDADKKKIMGSKSKVARVVHPLQVSVDDSTVGSGIELRTASSTKFAGVSTSGGGGSEKRGLVRGKGRREVDEDPDWEAKFDTELIVEEALPQTFGSRSFTAR